VATTGGYWLVRVLEREDDRVISEDDRDLLSAMALDVWVLGLWDSYSNKIESYLTDEMKQWAIERVSGG
jgi:hypothetical protein